MAIFSNRGDHTVRYDHAFEKAAAEACAKLTGQTVPRVSLDPSASYKPIGGMTKESQAVADQAVAGAILLSNAHQVYDIATAAYINTGVDFDST